MSKERGEVTGWRKAAEVFNKSESKRTTEDVKQELQRIRSEKSEKRDK
ncbi:hypothetical protein P4J13_14980 [Bacillus anthracis]|nr:hypothetical protein [Bacillus anthracis]MEB9505241.1 hypothetical protein [Bacillus anthracis]